MDLSSWNVLGIIMHGRTVANTGIYIMKQSLGTLLSSKVYEKFQIFEPHPKPLPKFEPLICSVTVDH